MKQYLALDLGGTYIKYALMGDDGGFLKQGRAKSPMDSMESLMDTIQEIGREFEGQYQGAAVSMPGRIDTKKGIAYTGGAFRFIKDAPMGQYFEERLHVPVTVVNDGKCAASAEAWSGALSDVDSGAVLVLGTGIGGGIEQGSCHALPRIWRNCRKGFRILAARMPRQCGAAIPPQQGFCGSTPKERDCRSGDTA